MADETDKFLHVTEAAGRMYEALSQLKQRTEDYAEAGQHLDAAAAKTQALTDATANVLEEQGRRWNELRQILDDQVRPALNRISDSAEKQAVHVSTLSGAVAGQQSQLTLVQQGLADNSRALSEIKPLLEKVEKVSSEQSRLLQQQSATLGEHQRALQQLARVSKNSMRAAMGAAGLSLVTMILVVVNLLA